MRHIDEPTKPYGCLYALVVVSALFSSLYAVANFLGRTHFLEVAPENEIWLSLSYLVVNLLNIPVVFYFYIKPSHWLACLAGIFSAISGAGAIIPGLYLLIHGSLGTGSAAAGIGALVGIIITTLGVCAAASSLICFASIYYYNKTMPNKSL